VAPEDTRVAYQDKYNKDELLFNIQREGSMVAVGLLNEKELL